MNAFMIFVAKYLIVLTPIIGGTYFFTQQRPIQKKMLFLAIASGILALVIARIGGILYFDPRPFVVGHFTPLIPHDPDNGFPSDHVLATALAASVVFPFNRKVAFVLSLITFLIAWARVYVDVHHVIDVMGSMVIAILAMWVAQVLLNRYKMT